ncbi:TcfC E-set like domain-containing protein [Rahnella aceris]
MKPNLKVSLCFLAIHFALFSNLALAGSDVPPGFEELVSGQNVWLNVNLLGQSAGLFEANVTLETIQFKDPQAVLTALNLPLKTGTPDYQKMLATLSAPLPRHGNLACSSNADARGCGYLETDSLALIYDENNSAADVFVSKALVPDADKKALYYTPTAQTENALIHQQTLNVAAQDQYQSLSLQGAGALGVLTSGYVGFDWSLDSYKSDDSDSQTVSVDDLYFRQSLGKRHYVQAGRMDSRDLSSNLGGNISFSLLPLNAIDGVRAGSSLSYLNLDEASKGSPLVVLLSSKSRVDAYRSNQLLGTFYLNNGSNTLDTGNFPSGSYAVTLRIYENNQLVRTETQPFTKTGGISDGHMQWFVQAGETADNKVVSSTDDEENDSTSRKPVMQAGARLPVFAELTATAGIANTDNENYGEAGLQWTHGFNGKVIDGVLDMQTSVFSGTDGSKGNVEQISYNDGFSMSVYRNAAYGKSCTSADVGENDYADIGCYESINATLSVPVKGWSASLGYTYNKNTSLSPDSATYDPSKPFEDNMINNTESQSTSKTLQLSLNKSFNWKQMTITTRFGGYRRQSSSDSDSDKGVYVGFSLSRNTPKDAQLRSSNTSFSTDYQGSQNGDAQMTYNASQNWDWGSNNDRELGIDVGGTDTDNANASVHGRLNGQYGEGELTVSDSYDNEQKTHQGAVTGSYSSSVAVSKSGFFWGPGGTGSPGAAVAVKVKGSNEEEADAADDALIDVSVQGGGAAHMKQNSKALFPVTGFEEGKVSVDESRDVSSGSQASITQGAGSQKLFLLPGKMKVREVTMESHYTYVGQLVTATGEPLTQGTLLNANAFSSSEDGGFTAEMTSLAKNLYLRSGSQNYLCAVTVQSSRDVVRYVGKTLCKPVQPADLPAAIREKK